MKKYIIPFIILFLTGCGYDPYKMPKDVTLNLNKISTEVYITVKVSDLIKNSNVKIIDKNKVLPSDEAKTYKYTIRYKYKKRIYKYDTTYKIIDSTPPIFLSIFKNKNVEPGEVNNLCSLISYADNYDRELSCSSESNFDSNTTGSYDVRYVVKDKSNNEVTYNSTITVREKIKSHYQNNSDISNKIDFKDFYETYKNDNNEIGIDVSKWQGNIDFNKVKKANASFVIIRIGISNEPNKDIEMDKYYKKNIEKAKKAGLKVGVYLYTTATSKNEAKNQAKWIINNVKDTKIDFPIVFDWESWDNFNNYKINLNDLEDIFNSFSEELEKNNYKSMLYSSKYFLENVWQNKKEKDVWLAHYIDETDYQGNYKLWQVNNIGRIDGINTDVDLDIWKK